MTKRTQWARKTFLIVKTLLIAVALMAIVYFVTGENLLADMIRYSRLLIRAIPNI